MSVRLSLTALPGEFAVCTLPRAVKIPDWIPDERFSSITRTGDELSIICPAEAVPQDVRCEKGWRCLKLDGPFELNAIGILLSVIQPLAEAGVSVLALGTFETDHVLINESKWINAIEVLRSSGHVVSGVTD